MNHAADLVFLGTLYLRFGNILRGIAGRADAAGQPDEGDARDLADAGG